MLLDNLIYIAIITVLGIGALSLNFFLTNREKNNKLKSERLAWLSEQTARVLEAIAALKQVNCKPEIVDKLNQLALVYIEEISMLAPDSDLMSEVNKQKESADRAAAGQAELSNDRELKRTQIYIRYAEKLIRQLNEKQKLNQKLADYYITELFWLNIRIVVEAHQTQSERFLKADDKLIALSHLKHAKAVLVRARVDQELKRPYLESLQKGIDELQPKRVDYGSSALDSALESMEREF